MKDESWINIEKKMPNIGEVVEIMTYPDLLIRRGSIEKIDNYSFGLFIKGLKEKIKQKISDTIYWRSLNEKSKFNDLKKGDLMLIEDKFNNNFYVGFFCEQTKNAILIRQSKELWHPGESTCLLKDLISKISKIDIENKTFID